MGFWDTLGKIALDAMQSMATVQDPAVRARMAEHVEALMNLDRQSPTDSFANIAIHAVASAALQNTYLKRLSNEDAHILQMYVTEQAGRAKANAADEDYDSREARLASRLESLQRVVDSFVRTLPSRYDSDEA